MFENFYKFFYYCKFIIIEIIFIFLVFFFLLVNHFIKIKIIYQNEFKLIGLNGKKNKKGIFNEINFSI